MLLTTSASVNSVRTKLGGAALLLLLLPPLIVALPKVGPCSRATGAGDLHDMKVLLHAAIAGVGEGTNDGSAGHASMMCRRGGSGLATLQAEIGDLSFPRQFPYSTIVPYVGGSPDLHVRHVHLRSGAHEHVDPGQLPVPHRVAGPLDLDESRRAARGAEGLGASAQGPRGAAGEQVRGGGAPCWGPT